MFGDFNFEIGEYSIYTFIDNLRLINLLKEPTCFKSDNPEFI